MKISDVYREISDITIKLIELGLSVQQNFPFRKGSTISCKDGSDLSAVLRDVSYSEKYEVLDKEKNYNIKLLDGAIIQMMYAFNSKGTEIISHRLAFFPAPHLENYEDDPEAHEQKYYGESEYHDHLEKNVIKTPLRFDYNNSKKMFEDINHPYSHLHLGEYGKCRIPVCSPLTPASFVNFILRNFYNSALRNYCDNFSFPTLSKFDSTITENECKLIHLNIN